jgi:putative alpha-1,2-mannosidase
MGFFPVAGQDVYLLTAPMFDEVNVILGNGKTFKIKANKLSDKNIYIKSVILNGTVLERAWFSHAEISNGGVMEIEMTNKPKNWDKILPPSLSLNNQNK